MTRFFTSKLLFAIISVLPLAVSAQGVYQLWGTTGYGGPTNTGTIFSMGLEGNTFANRYNFVAQNYAVGTGESKLTEYNGKFYGTASFAGINGDGVLFEWDPVTNVFTSKVNFDFINGAHPGDLLLKDGKLYGTTRFGGINSGGVLFEYDPSTNIYAKKVEFAFLDGGTPSLTLALKDNKIYGTTMTGGVANAGVIFEFDPATSIYTKKYELQFATGIFVYGGLTLYSNKFYGLSQMGGTGSGGVIFEWDPVTNVFTDKHDFIYGDAGGFNPQGSLTVVGTKLYGMTVSGGSFTGGPTSGNGVIFEFDPATSTYSKKINFTPATGFNPYGSLELFGGKLYGMTSTGGTNNAGTLFEYDPDAPLFTKKSDMAVATGSNGRGSLLLSNNKMYGMLPFGGTDYNGVLFEWDPVANVYNKKIDLLVSNGMGPTRQLSQKNGRFYGFASSGAAGLYGSLYEFIPGTSQLGNLVEMGTVNGAVPAYNGSSTINGSFPCATLVEKSGKYYGLTLSGGVNDQGTIFEWDPVTNAFVKKKDLPAVTPVSPTVERGFILPMGVFVPYNNKYVGIINKGGAEGVGYIFEWDPSSNNFAVLKDFTVAGGAIPYPSLDSFNGKFYGTTHLGGANNEGALFEWDPVTNILNKKIDFAAGINGSRPLGNLTLVNNKFYGHTYIGGLNDRGVLFEYDPTGNTYTKKKDAAAADFGVGKPFGRLVKNGNRLYGLAGQGGDNDSGAVFEWRPLVDSFIIRHSFNGTDGLMYFDRELLGFNELSLDSAAIAQGTPGACESYTYQSPINAANYNSWIPLTDSKGDVIAELRANGNTLGTLNYSLFKNDGPLRIEFDVRTYLDRQLVITPQFQPTTPVDIRVYGTKEEFERVAHATDSIGAPYNYFTDFDDFHDLRIIKRSGSNCTATIPAWAPTEPIDFPYSTAEAYGEDGYVIKFSVSSFSTIYIVNFSVIPLPVKLLSFDGKTVGEDAELAWKTSNESNLKHFVLERSINGKDFVPAGTVAAINDPADHEYKYIDKQIQSLGVSRVYYRLLQQDIDGKAVYSRVIVLTLNAKGNIAMIYPNPVKKDLGLMINLQRAQSIKWTITDNSGRSVKQGSAFITSGSTNTNLNISSLAPGVYYLSLEGEQVSQKLKFLKE